MSCFNGLKDYLNRLNSDLLVLKEMGKKYKGGPPLKNLKPISAYKWIGFIIQYKTAKHKDLTQGIRRIDILICEMSDWEGTLKDFLSLIIEL